MNKDLTVGSPTTVLIKFCMPLLGSMLFQQLYNLADSFVAGKFIGETALAAVGNSYEITMIFLAFAFGCNIACSVIVAQFFGAKNFGALKTSVYTTLISIAALCLVLMILGLAFCPTLLSCIKTPDNIFGDSLLYLNIYILGLPFVFFYNISTGIFSALGDSKTPFIFLACSSTANILMNIWFVVQFKMGVAGVAWATFICQGISCTLAISFVLKRLHSIKTDEKISRFSFPVFLRLATIAVPSILQQSFISVGNIFIQSIINSFGSAIIAGYAASIKLNNFAIISLATIGGGISNFTAQNMGAQKPARIRKGSHAGLLIAWSLIVPIAVAFFIFARPLVYFFIDSPTELALSTGETLLRILSPFYAVVATKLIYDGVLRGMQKMTFFMVATFADLLLRVGLAFFLSAPLGPTGIWLAWPIGWSVATVISALLTRKTLRNF